MPLELDLDLILDLVAQDFIGSRVAILGSSGNGKTNTLALILEHILSILPFTIFDPHNEYYGLAEQFEFLRVGKNAPAHLAEEDDSPPVHIEAGPDQAADIAEMAFKKRISVLVQMQYMDEDERLEFVYNYCAKLWELKNPRKPYGVVLEEAQNFIPETKALTEALKMLKRFALEGRKFGITLILSSQRCAEISKTVLAMCRVAFLHGVDILADVTAYAGMLPITLAETKKIALGLGTGECIVKVKRNGPAQFHYKVRMCQRKTLHVGETPTVDENEHQANLRAVDESLVGEFKKALDISAPSDPAPAASASEQGGAKTVSGTVVAVPAPAPSIDLRYIPVAMAAYAEMERLRKEQAAALDAIRASHKKEIDGLEKQLAMARQRSLEPVGYDAPPDQMEFMMGAGETTMIAEQVVETTRTVTRFDLTSRQLVLRQNAQRRIYDNVIDGARALNKTDRIILIEAFADETKVVDLHTVAPLYDLSYDTMRLRIPELVKLGLVVKTAPGMVRSVITSMFQVKCPNLETVELVEGLWKVIGK